jgi:adenine-specific DNA-methyltransferase
MILRFTTDELDIRHQRGLDDCAIAAVVACNSALACAVRYYYPVKSRRTKLMDKLEMKTPNLADENFAALARLFPNAVTETIDANGAIVRAIDKDVLTQEINAHVVDSKEERYQFTWPDKRKSVLLANAPIAAALRPCREESVDFDTTENLYIEGDNLDVLKLLRETYLNCVKMIYIEIMTTRLIQINFASVGRFQGGAKPQEGVQIA